MSSISTKNWILLLAIGFWAASLTAALQFTQWQGDLGFHICGPWGCGPPVQALIGCHLAWLLLLMPLPFLIGSVVRPSHRSIISRAIFLIGITGPLSFVVANAVKIARGSPEAYSDYFMQRIFFETAVDVDHPSVQLMVVGCCMALCNRYVRDRH